MEQNIELLLDNCIDEIRKGKSIDECLADYPQYTDELKPLLQLAVQIENLPQPNPSSEALSSALINIGKEMERNTAAAEISEAIVPSQGDVLPQKGFAASMKKRKTFSFFSEGSFRNVFRKSKLAWALSTALLLFFISLGATTLSANSVPGDILYPLKLVTEKVRFLLTFDSYGKAELRLNFSDKRLNELVEVFQKSNKLDTTLLKNMLDEAKLALEENEIPVEKASILTAKLNHVSAYQKNVLENIRPNVQSSDRKIVDEAINMCGMRSRWMRRMMNEEYQEQYDKQDTTPQSQTPHRKRHRPQRMQWGEGCDWMR
ncbi:MAG: DUF5667 domain-containing protein [Bacteroidetes bacterium]|nr:DUF5667 domain-containing protein [Bacteroidota bacterium]